MNWSIAKIYRHHNPSAAALILRVLLGVLFVSSGWMKLSAWAMTLGFFQQMGFNSFLAYSATWTEIIAGVLLIIGLLVKPSSVALATVMAVVVFGLPGQPYNIFFGHNYEFFILVTLVALYTLGAGRYSVAHLIGRRSAK